MTNLTKIALVALLLFVPMFVFANVDEVEDLLEIPVEYRDEIEDRLKESREFTEEQIEIITACLDESSMTQVLNCFSRGGIDEAANIWMLINEELANMEERLCGKSTFFEKDRCEQIKESLDRIREQMDGIWSTTMERGRKYLKEKNELIFLKRKICKKINQKGCWSWLNERLLLKCNPNKMGADLRKLEKCRLDVANDVWERLN